VRSRCRDVTWVRETSPPRSSGGHHHRHRRRGPVRRRARPAPGSALAGPPRRDVLPLRGPAPGRPAPGRCRDRPPGPPTL